MHTARPHLLFSLLTALCTAAIFVALCAQAATPPLRAFVLAINFTAFALSGLDKSFARSQTVRVPEVCLYLVALLGGSAGVFLGMYVFRHKTRKAAFQFVLLGIVTAQLLVLRALEISL